MKFHVAEQREKLGLTVRELAFESGVAKSHIQKIEAGRANPTVSVMCRLAEALQCEVCELFSCGS